MGLTPKMCRPFSFFANVMYITAIGEKPARDFLLMLLIEWLSANTIVHMDAPNLRTSFHRTASSLDAPRIETSK